MKYFITGGSGVPDETCIEFFKDTDVIVITRDGKRYFRGTRLCCRKCIHWDCYYLNDDFDEYLACDKGRAEFDYENGYCDEFDNGYKEE